MLLHTCISQGLTLEKVRRHDGSGENGRRGKMGQGKMGQGKMREGKMGEGKMGVDRVKEMGSLQNGSAVHQIGVGNIESIYTRGK